MKHVFPGLALLLVVVFHACLSSKKTGPASNKLEATDLLAYGRTDRNSEHLELIGSASYFGFEFTGSACTVNITTGSADRHGYVQYELDGKYKERVRVNGNDEEKLTIHADGEGKHTVWLYKATEAASGPIYVNNIEGRDLRALKKQGAPFIEFIGNSITCGAASDPSAVACGAGVYLDQHNAYMAYGPRVARALGLNFMLSSVSGIGIYRNWNSDGPTMPQVYEKTDFVMDGSRSWDFSTYHPSIVSIALGTNDYSNGDGKKYRAPFDPASYVSNYIKFVQLVRSKYPSARIALLSSPMVNGARRDTLQNCLTAVKKNIDQQYPAAKPVALYFFKPMIPRGCGYHPNVEDHAILAEELTPFFKQLLNE